MSLPKGLNFSHLSQKINNIGRETWDSSVYRPPPHVRALSSGEVWAESDGGHGCGAGASKSLFPGGRR